MDRCIGRIEWSTVSQAAERSKKTRAAARSPRSTAWSISDNTQSTSASVEWQGLKPDSRGGIRSADDKYSNNQTKWLTTKRFKSLDSTGTLEIGRYEPGLVSSSPGFCTALHGMQTRSDDENSVRPSVRLSVRPSLRLSNACIVTKRKKDLSRFLYHTKDHLA